MAPKSFTRPKCERLARPARSPQSEPSAGVSGCVPARKILHSSSTHATTCDAPSSVLVRIPPVKTLAVLCAWAKRRARGITPRSPTLAV
jgi:hypothetical protein